MRSAPFISAHLRRAVGLRRAFPAAQRHASARAPEKVDLARAFAAIDEPWDPRVCADVRGGAAESHFQLKAVQLAGDFVWHQHEDEDELFLVMRGEMRMKLRTGDVDLSPGELITIPRGVEHCPEALTETCDVLLLEPATTLNTGSAAEAIGDAVHEKSNRGASLTKTELKRVDKS